MNRAWLKGPPAWKKGPLIDDDANTIAHVYWRNGALVDSKGNAWAMTGTVPQAEGAGTVPPGAGPFTSSQRYTLGAGSDALDIAGAFSVIAILTNPPAGGGVVVCDGTGAVSAGWAMTVGATAVTFQAGATAQRIVTLPAGVSVVCGGYTGAINVVKLNLDTYTSSGAATYAADATAIAMIGTLSSGVNWFNQGLIYEILITTTAPSDAAFTAHANSVKSKIRGLRW